MKKALILHGIKGNSQKNWLPWLKSQLEDIGYNAWAPDLPQADEPNIQRYNKHILKNSNFKIDKNTILIGHSAGAVAILGLLETLPNDTCVRACYFVSPFKNDLGWDCLRGLFTSPFDFKKIKKKSQLFYFIHSNNDPYCPLSHAEYLHKNIGGDLIVLPKQKHFNIKTCGKKYRKFPYLFHLIAGDVLGPSDIIELYESLENMGVKIWLDGGWGVDALLEKQTRNHGDLDIVIQKKDVDKLNKLLKDQGYREILRGDTSSYNYMLGDDKPKLIDIHVIRLDKKGNGIYGPAKNGVMYKAEALSGRGKLNGREVRCISPEWVVKFHSGYKLRESDYHDVLSICKKFKIKIPKEFGEEPE